MKYADLIKRLSDLRTLAFAAPDGERGGCMSSYDRASRYNPETDTYENWGANEDGSGCIRRLSDGSIVAFECEGPGVIWRVWSALPEQGHMRIYFDDAPEPAVDVPFIDWFEKQPGDVPPLNLPELSAKLSRGRNSFIPIPFSGRCRIELAPGWGMYYHFTYTRFPDGTPVPDYAERFGREGMIALAEADRRLYRRGETGRRADRAACRRLSPGETAQMLSLSGAGAIEECALRPRGLNAKALRTLVMRIYWDGRERPAVEAPLGDFFGGAPGYAHYRCLPMSMESERFSCRFFMPFENGCRVEIENMGEEEASVEMEFALARECPERGSLRFHAKWHRGYFGSLDRKRFAPGGDRWPDWPLLLVYGARGRFLGVHLHIVNEWERPAQRPSSWWYGAWDQKTVDWWWGEGDEKFFVDGEAFPSTFGTGSEDYIGYAWAAEPPFALFDSAFACMNAMPLDGNGHTSVSRFHVADAVPFTNRFEGFIEKYKEDEWSGGRCLYAATPYWMQEAGTDDGYPPVRRDDLLRGWTERDVPSASISSESGGCE